MEGQDKQSPSPERRWLGNFEPWRQGRGDVISLGNPLDGKADMAPLMERPYSTFRCVMITDDTQIDRRILLQAGTLQNHGAEVILLAQGGGGNNDTEIVNGVKIFRYYAPTSQTDLPGKFLNLQQRFVARLNARSLRLQDDLNKAYGSHNTSLARYLASHQYVRAAYHHAQMRKLLKTHSLRKKYTVTAPAILSLRLATKAGSITTRLSPPKALDEHIADLAILFKPDVVHVHDLPQLKAGVLVKRELGIPLIYDAHELYPEIGTLTEQQKADLDKRERTLIKKADARSTVNPYIAREMAKRYKIDEPKTLLNATQRPSDFTAGDDRLRMRLAIPKGEQILLFQGWYHESRGLNELIEAMHSVRKGVHLVFLGYGQRQEAEALVARLGLEGCIHFLDKVPWDELLCWTTGADAGIIPYQKSDLNNYLCSPNKLFEFILAELPIISNDFPFLRDVIANNKFGITADLSSPETFAAAINAMFDKRTKPWLKLRSTLRSMSSNWSWSKQEPVLLDMYKSVGIPLRHTEGHSS